MAKNKTFDDLEVRRPELAVSYLQLLAAQPGRPIALFAPRRVGKTHFLDRDLSPAAVIAGLLPVYADIWLHRASPLDAINHALEEALDDIKVPGSASGKIARTPVKGISALSASLSFGDEPARRNLPQAPELRFDALIARLASAAKKPIVLMLDEIQALGETETGKVAIATLRAVLQKRKAQVRAVFTGSSQDALSAMTVSAGAPMYQFTQMLDFPYLDDAYLVLLADHFGEVHKGKRIDMNALRRVFAHIGFKPALMKDIVKEMSAEGISDVDLGLRRFIADERQVTGWQAVLNGLDPVDQLVLIVLANGIPPTSKEALDTLARVRHADITLSKVRTALARMRKAGILSKPAAEYRIEDTLFADYIIRTAPLQTLIAPQKAALHTTRAPSRKR
ncbi:ATP-binding protein [soil metagenome]